MAVMEINKDNFEKEVLQAQGTVFLDLWAVWCGPCQMMAPVVEALSEERPDVKFCKVNVDEEMEIARRYQVMSIPTFLVLRDGEVVKRTLGVQSKEELEALL